LHIIALHHHSPVRAAFADGARDGDEVDIFVAVVVAVVVVAAAAAIDIAAVVNATILLLLLRPKAKGWTQWTRVEYLAILLTYTYYYYQ
jgi:hypothetical protein